MLTTELRVTGVYCAGIGIVAVNESGLTEASLWIAVIVGTGIVITTELGIEQTAFCRDAAIDRARIIVVTQNHSMST